MKELCFFFILNSKITFWTSRDISPCQCEESDGVPVQVSLEPIILLLAIPFSEAVGDATCDNSPLSTALLTTKSKIVLVVTADGAAYITGSSKSPALHQGVKCHLALIYLNGHPITSRVTGISLAKNVIVGLMTRTLRSPEMLLI